MKYPVFSFYRIHPEDISCFTKLLDYKWVKYLLFDVLYSIVLLNLSSSIEQIQRNITKSRQNL